MIRNGYVQHPIHLQRCALYDRKGRSPLRSNLCDPVHPLGLESFQIGGGDLGERAVALAAVIAIERGPTADRCFSDRVRVKRHFWDGKRGADKGRGGDGCAECRKQLHFRVSRYAVTLCISSFVSVITISWCAA